MPNNKIIVILGPTASGKSSAAIALARKFDGEIISVDSRQIYRGLDIGTGKVTRDFTEILNSKDVFLSEGIPHHMLDIINPDEDFSAAQFKKMADALIADILQRGKLPILCGGTGFWIQAVVDDVTYPEVKPDWELRNQLRNKPVEELFAQLEKIDPQRARTIDQKNPVRLIRALEICRTLGRVPATNHKLKTKNYKILQIGIQRNKEILHQRIRKNIETRLDQGMIAEVETLKASGLSWEKIESFGLSYKLIPQYLRGEIATEEELLEKIYLVEKNYAKRQMTWFARDQRIIWTDNYSEIEETTANFLKK